MTQVLKICPNVQVERTQQTFFSNGHIKGNHLLRFTTSIISGSKKQLFAKIFANIFHLDAVVVFVVVVVSILFRLKKVEINDLSGSVSFGGYS